MIKTNQYNKKLSFAKKIVYDNGVRETDILKIILFLYVR